MKKLTTAEFIEKAKKVHGERYDYSKVYYVDIKTEIKIICNEHGEFEQTPVNHLNGNNCQQCAELNRQTAKYLNTLNKRALNFIEKAKKLHENKYNYDQVEYTISTDKVKIICPEHGEFYTTPENHLRGDNCLKCGNEISVIKRTSSKEEFIEKAKKEHGDKYDYTATEYIKSYVKVKIICKEHGEFEQMPRDHIRGCGCGQCANDARKK